MLPYFLALSISMARNNLGDVTKSVTPIPLDSPPLSAVNFSWLKRNSLIFSLMTSAAAGSQNGAPSGNRSSSPFKSGFLPSGHGGQSVGGEIPSPLTPIGSGVPVGLQYALTWMPRSLIMP